MDLFTHVALPLLLGRWLKKSAEEVAALALGGLAPDLDIFLLPINWIHPNFFLLVHRGITHTLLFGFFASILVLFLATVGPVRSQISQHFGLDPKFTRRAILFAYVGVLVHLALDGLTTRGIPLLYPIDFTRISAEIFFYSETPLLLASLGILIIEVKRQGLIDPQKMIILLLLFLVLTGCVRLAEKDRAEVIFGDDARAFPATNLFEWTVLAEDGGDVRVYSYDALSREVLLSGDYPKMNASSSEDGLKAALDVAENLPQVRTFRWRAYEVVISAAFRDGGWDLAYRDPVMAARMMGMPTSPRGFFSGLVSLDVRVEGERAKVRNGGYHIQKRFEYLCIYF